MLKASEAPPNTPWRAFNAQLIGACQLPRATLAKLALVHRMNANILHRRLKEHARSGCHQIAPPDIALTSSPPTVFFAAKPPHPSH